MAHELDDVWMGFHDFHSPRAVGLLGHQPEKVGGVLGGSWEGFAIVACGWRRDDGTPGGAFALCERFRAAKIAKVWARSDQRMQASDRRTYRLGG